MLQDVPTVLGGRYRVVERLGRGGMADVYRAEDQVLGRLVAIKVFRAGVERDHHLTRFRAEVRTLARLTHPHLVALYDAGGDSTEPWCAMEYVDGGSLGDRHGPLPPDQVARIGEHVAGALAYVHGEGIVHRDVKPSNVLLDHEGGAFLSDFGIARLVDGTRITQSGLMIGTAAFLSPEQVRGATAGPACDVYALGLVLLEALTGRREYPGTPVESAVARLTRPPQVPDDLGDDWHDLLTRMMAETPADRPDPSAVADALGRIARRSIVPLEVPAASMSGVILLRPDHPGDAPESAESAEEKEPAENAEPKDGDEAEPDDDAAEPPDGVGEPPDGAGEPYGEAEPPDAEVSGDPSLAQRRRGAIALLVAAAVTGALVIAFPLLDGRFRDDKNLRTTIDPTSTSAPAAVASSSSDEQLYHRGTVAFPVEVPPPVQPYVRVATSPSTSASVRSTHRTTSTTRTTHTTTSTTTSSTSASGRSSSSSATGGGSTTSGSTSGGAVGGSGSSTASTSTAGLVGGGARLASF
jgi:serine/threonine protein kinase